MRYFFDIQDGSSLARDDFGIECRSDYAARVEATRALTDMASDYLPTDGEHRNMSIHVRNGKATLFTVNLKYDVFSADEVRDAVSTSSNAGRS